MTAIPSRRHVAKGFWAILDHGTFAATHFLLNVLLARWLSPTEYGVFAAGYALLLLAGTLHEAIFTEPMLVYTGTANESLRRPYMRVLLRFHFGVTGLATLVAVPAAAALGFLWTRLFTEALFAVAVTLPFILVHWLLRCACYALLQARAAALGSLLYLAVLVPMTYAAQSFDTLSTPRAFMIMAVAAIAAGAAICALLRLRPLAGTADAPARKILALHWSYGRWAIGTNMLQWLPKQIFFLVLPLVAGLSLSGALRALMNLVTPVLHVFTAVATLALPMLSRMRARGDETFRRAVRFLLALLVLLGAGYSLSLSLAAGSIVTWLYQGQYAEYLPYLAPLLLLPPLTAVASTLQCAMRASERPNAVFWATLLAAVVATPAGIVLAALLDLQGAIWGRLLATAVAALALMHLYFRRAAPRPVRTTVLGFREPQPLP